MTENPISAAKKRAYQEVQLRERLQVRATRLLGMLKGRGPRGIIEKECRLIRQSGEDLRELYAESDGRVAPSEE